MKNKQIEEIVKIICQYRADDGKCTCNQHQFGVRNCADPCVYRDIAEQVVDAGYAPVVHGEWETDKEDIEWGNSLKKKYCSVCGKRPWYDRINREFVLTSFCPNCGAKMDGGSDAS